jgi:hypothetical protein
MTEGESRPKIPNFHSQNDFGRQKGLPHQALRPEKKITKQRETLSATLLAPVNVDVKKRHPMR